MNLHPLLLRGREKHLMKLLLMVVKNLMTVVKNLMMKSLVMVHLPLHLLLLLKLVLVKSLIVLMFLR